MGHSRPLASRRLQQAIAVALGTDLKFGDESAARLRRVLCSVTQEKRFLVLMFLKQRDDWVTDLEIADAVRDLHANVKRNLYVLLSERVILARRDPETGAASFRINQDIMRQLSALFDPAPHS